MWVVRFPSGDFMRGRKCSKDPQFAERFAGPDDARRALDAERLIFTPSAFAKAEIIPLAAVAGAAQ